MSEFVVGTKVRVIAVDFADECMGLHVGDTGTVVSYERVGFSGTFVLVEWDTEHPHISYNVSGCYLRQIEEVK